MASLWSKQRSCVILVAWKFLFVPLNCKDLGSLLKAVDLHISDISVTEKEGAAVLARMSSALNQMLQVWFQPDFQCAQCQTSSFKQGEKRLDPRSTPNHSDKGVEACFNWTKVGSLC